jgi:PleD family two-component response regulator
MLAKFRTVTITHGEHTLSGLTFSAGIAEYASEKDRATVFDQADAALYTVKQSTRDAVEVYQAPPLPNRPAGGSE